MLRADHSASSDRLVSHGSDVVYAYPSRRIRGRCVHDLRLATCSNYLPSLALWRPSKYRNELGSYLETGRLHPISTSGHGTGLLVGLNPRLYVAHPDRTAQLQPTHPLRWHELQRSIVQHQILRYTITCFFSLPSVCFPFPHFP
jgi:hypothetical protein